MRRPAAGTLLLVLASHLLMSTATLELASKRDGSVRLVRPDEARGYWLPQTLISEQLCSLQDLDLERVSFDRSPRQDAPRVVAHAVPHRASARRPLLRRRLPRRLARAADDQPT